MGYAEHSALIRSDGTLWVSGHNGYKQLGVGDIGPSTRNRLQVGSENDWKEVHTSYFNTLALKHDGTLWGWGQSTQGVLCNESTEDQPYPILINSDKDWSKISLGYYSVLAIKKDGSLWGWGNNTTGLMGNGLSGSTEIYRAPVRIGIENDWADVSVGNSHALVLKKDGTLWACGNNSLGKLGLNNTTNFTTFQILNSGMVKYKKAIAGTSFSLGIREDDSLWSWGSNTSGELGLNNTTTRMLPTKVLYFDNDAKDISSGRAHVFAIKKDGTLWGWGDRSAGKMGAGSTSGGSQLVPQKIGIESDWESVSCMMESTQAIKTDGSLWGWGKNQSGELGDGNSNYPYEVYSPVCNDKSTVSFEKIERGSVFSIALKKNRSLWAWGLNQSIGYLGNGDDKPYYLPIQIGKDTDWKDIAAGNNHTIALKTNGRLMSWGNSSVGELGYSGSSKTPRYIGTDTDWDKIYAGPMQGAGIKKDGTLWVWGYSAYNQLGLGSTANVYSPRKINDDTDWLSISFGTDQTLALKKDGTLWAWGRSRIGTGTTAGSSVPVKIGVDTDWVSISSGGQHTFAIKSNGTIWAWGANSYGQHGDGTTDIKLVPTQVGADSDWKSVIAYENHTIAIKSDNKIYVAGRSAFGQLGIGSTETILSFTLIVDDTHEKQVSTSTQSTYINYKDRFYAAGENSNGQLGLSKNVDAYSFEEAKEKNFRWSMLMDKNLKYEQRFLFLSEGKYYKWNVLSDEGWIDVSLENEDPSFISEHGMVNVEQINQSKLDLLKDPELVMWSDYEGDIETTTLNTSDYEEGLKGKVFKVPVSQTQFKRKIKSIR